MRLPALLSTAVLLAGCDRPEPVATLESPPPRAKETAPAAADVPASFVRINSTRQRWNPGQPWEKRPPRQRRSLGAVIEGPNVLTTAEMVTDATYVELETVDGLERAPATVVAVDYEANLALLALESEDDAGFLGTLDTLAIADPLPRGETVDIIQIQDNGTPLVTSGPIQSLDVVANFLPSEYFLTYEVKASMQSAASSYSLPVLHEGRLAGVLTNYNSDDQLSDVAATEVVRAFLKDAADGDYTGFPSLGVATSATEDEHFREWLKLPEDAGGIHVSRIRDGGSADRAGLREGDVITAIDGRAIDRLGYFDHERYGRLFWSHLVRGSKQAGETISVELIRDGAPQTVELTLRREPVSESLVPAYTFGEAPNFLIKGGMVFQELTQPLLEAFGDEWRARAPLNLLDVWENPEDYEEDRERVVFLAGVIATPATVGYEPLRNLIVDRVNDRPVRDMDSLLEAFDAVPDDGLHEIDFADEDINVYLDEVTATQVDSQLLGRGITTLSRSK